MPRRKNRTSDRARAGVATITYAAKRKNIPPAGLEAHGVVRETPTIRHEFNPHLPPALRFSPAAARLPELLAAARERALSAEEAPSRPGYPGASSVAGRALRAKTRRMLGPLACDTLARSRRPCRRAASCIRRRAVDDRGEAE